MKRLFTAAMLLVALLAPARAQGQPKEHMGRQFLAAIQIGLWPTETIDPGFAPRIRWDMEYSVLAAASAASAYKAGGTPDEAIAADIALGHVLRMVGEYDAALTVLEGALAAGQARGWNDERAHVALHHLAALYADKGDARAIAFEQRARACVAPCAPDATLALFASIRDADRPEAKAAFEAALGTMETYRQGRDIIRRLFGERTEWSLAFADHFAVAFRDTLPMTAMTSLEEKIALMTSFGAAPVDIALGQLELARYHRELGQYARSAEIAAAAESAFSDPVLAAQALHMRAMALVRLGDPGGVKLLDEVAERFATVPAVMDSTTFGWEVAEDLYSTGRHDAAARLIIALFPDTKEMRFTWPQRCLAGHVALYRIFMAQGQQDEAIKRITDIAEVCAPTDALLEAFIPEFAAALDELGMPYKASELRARAGSPVEIASSAPDEILLGYMTLLRGFGAVKGAGALADALATEADSMIERATYEDAQKLWQIAYTQALAGKQAEAFRLMKAAASIAVRRSFASANATDGGSLQLLQRDRWRYLLFFDIAWSAAKGLPPDNMLVPFKY